MAIGSPKKKNGKNSEEQKSNIEDIAFEALPKEEKKEEIIDFTENPEGEIKKEKEEIKPEQEKKKEPVNFFGNDFSSALLEKEVEKNIYAPEQKDNIPEGALTDEEKENLKKQFEKEREEEKKTEGKFLEFEDCLDFAEVGIETLDTVCGEICKWISDEKTTAKFELPKKRKTNLSYMLAKILTKHQIKLSIEVLFAVSIVIAFGTNIKLAFKIKSDSKKKIKHFTDETIENGGKQEPKTASINTKNKAA